MSARHGMTLVELVVAITVAGLAVSAGYAALGAIADRGTYVRRAADETARAVTVRRTLATWLEGVRLPIDEPASFTGLDASHEGSPSDELTFLTNAPITPGSQQSVVRLYVDRDERTPERGVTAEVRAWRGTRTERIEVEPHARSLSIRYLSGVLGERAWLGSWISTSVLPAAVEITLGGAPADTVAIALALPLVVPLGAGQ